MAKELPLAAIQQAQALKFLPEEQPEVAALPVMAESEAMELPEAVQPAALALPGVVQQAQAPRGQAGEQRGEPAKLPQI